MTTPTRRDGGKESARIRRMLARRTGCGGGSDRARGQLPVAGLTVGGVELAASWCPGGFRRFRTSKYDAWGLALPAPQSTPSQHAQRRMEPVISYGFSPVPVAHFFGALVGGDAAGRRVRPVSGRGRT